LDVVWEISDSTIATIDQSGRVHGKARGFATVRASVGDKSATATVNVTFAAVASVAATLPDSSLVEGERVPAAVVIKDANGAVINGVPVSWQSSNPSVATVDA
jgi:alpha-amylase